ncbi:hypothetical protein VTN00DRAFT_4964 [Thermoascus crustaceus]|uniref:uncharacterized protein n=1 Tax=Thermoascus crustaceus TaxID=5088 RepID=UPI003743B989
MPVKEVSSIEEFRNITNSSQPSVFDFWATWCGPCKAISPVFEKFSDSEEFKGVGFYKVEVDSAQEIAQAVGITSMPYFICWKDGKQQAGFPGAVPQNLEKLVKYAKTLAG